MLKVLFVEPKKEDRKPILSPEAWEKLGATVIGSCSSYTEAVESILHLRPDLVFTELQLGDATGIDLIRWGRENAAYCDFGIISSVQEFEYAQRAMRLGIEEYLSKPLDAQELARVLEKYVLRKSVKETGDESERLFRTRRSLCNSFMETLTSQNDQNVPKHLDLETLNRKYHFNMQEGIFQSAILIVDSLPEMERGVFLPALAENLRTRFDPVCYEMIPLVQGDKRLSIILNYMPNSAARERLSELQGILQQHMQKRECSNVTFCIGVGEPETDIAMLRRTLDTAERAVRCGIFRGRNQTFWYDKMKFDAIKSEDVLTTTLVMEMRKAAAIFDTDGFTHAVRDAFAPVSPYTDPAVIIQICNVAVNIVVSVCEKAGYGDVCEISKQKILTRLGNVTSLPATVHDLLKWVERQFDRCRESDKSSKSVRDAKKYIDRYYMRKISLEELAQHVHLNSSYLSILFKRETGQNFSNYLTNRRMEAAKELLRQSDMSIAAICEAVGYTENKYFSRIFTRLVGVKPSAYRALYR